MKTTESPTRLLMLPPHGLHRRSSPCQEGADDLVERGRPAFSVEEARRSAGQVPRGKSISVGCHSMRRRREWRRVSFCVDLAHTVLTQIDTERFAPHPSHILCRFGTRRPNADRHRTLPATGQPGALTEEGLFACLLVVQTVVGRG
jgi:hypothetical protein